MASTVRAEPLEAAPAASLAAIIKLQARGHHKKKQKRVSSGDCCDLYSSMCEVPYSVAAPVAQLVANHHGINYSQQQEAVGVCWQQHLQVTANSSCCPDDISAATAANRRLTGGPSNSISSGSSQPSCSADGCSEKQRQHSNSSPQSQGSGGSSGDEGRRDDAWRRRKAPAVKGPHSGQEQAEKQTQQDVVVQHHTGDVAARSSSSIAPRINGFNKGHGPKQHSSYEMQQQLDIQLHLPGLPSNGIEQQGWMAIQFGDLPHQLGTSPGGEKALLHVDSNGSHGHQIVSAMTKAHHSSTAERVLPEQQLQGCSSFPQQQREASEVSACAEPLSAHMAAVPALQQCPNAVEGSLGKLQNGFTQQHVVKVAGSLNGKHGGRTTAAVATSGAEQQVLLQSDLQQLQQQQQPCNGLKDSGLQQQQQRHQPDSAPCTPHSKECSGELLSCPLSPQLSPQLLKQFGLRVAPLNGCMLPDESQLRAAIQQAGVGAVLAVRDGNECQRPPSASAVPNQQQSSAEVSSGSSKVNQQSIGTNGSSSGMDGRASARAQQRQRSSPRAADATGAVASSPHGRHGSNGTHKHSRGQPQQTLHVQHQHQQHLQVQVPDAGVDDCSIASSGSSVQTSSTTSNQWQQHESAVVALQFSSSHHGPGSSSRTVHGQQHPGFGALAGHQQQQLYLGHSNGHQSQQHTDQTDIMSDPGTVPGGAFEGCNGYSRLKPGRNRFGQQQHIGGPAAGPYGTRHHGQEQPLLTQQLAGGGSSGNSRRGGGGGGGGGSHRDHGANDGSSHGSGADRGDQGGSRGGRGGGGGSSRDGDGSSSGSGGRRGGDRGSGRRNSKGSSLDYGMPRSPQMGAGSNRRSFDTRGGGGGYDDKRGGGRHTPLPSPGGGRSSREQHRGGGFNSHSSSRNDLRDVASPNTAGSSSSSNLVGQPSPLLLPEPALAPGPSSSRGAGIAPMDLPPSVAAAAGLPATGPLTDLERFLAAAGPTVPVDPAMPLQRVLEGLTLKSVWDLFLEPSLLGSPVNTMGGPRGPSTAYYVPFMSAMQLFTTVTDVCQPSQAVPPNGSSSAGNTSSSSSDSGSTDGSNAGSPTPSSCDSSNSGSSSYAAAAAVGAQAASSSFLRSPSNAAANVAAAAAFAAGSAPVGPGGRGRLYTCAVKGWPTVMRLLLEHMEQELPFSRDPFYIQLEAMAGGAEAVEAAAAATAAAAEAAGTVSSDATNSSSDAGNSANAAAVPSAAEPGARPAAAAVGGFTACGYPLVGPDLMSTRLMDVHPASWFAVAWYPVYRIPDAPLTARFLTFYSFSQLLEVLNDAVSLAKADLSAPCRLAGLPMPVVGMKWYNLMGERWLELLGSTAQPAAISSSNRRSRESSRDSSGPPGSADGGSQLLRLQMHPQRFRDWQARLQDLQGVAERLSKGAGLKVLTPQGPKEVRLYHSDYEFFNSRG